MPTNQTTIHTKRILMVDDDDMMRILFRETFWIHSRKDLMIEVQTVRTIQEAREYVTEHHEHLDVLFLGLWLPVEQSDGSAVRETLPSLEFIKELRKKEDFKDLTIVVYSRFSEEEFKKSACEAGADHYLVKGEITPHEMVQFVERL